MAWMPFDDVSRGSTRQLELSRVAAPGVQTLVNEGRCRPGHYLHAGLERIVDGARGRKTPAGRRRCTLTIHPQVAVKKKTEVRRKSCRRPPGRRVRTPLSPRARRGFASSRSGRRTGWERARRPAQRSRPALPARERARPGPVRGDEPGPGVLRRPAPPVTSPSPLTSTPIMPRRSFRSRRSSPGCRRDHRGRCI